MSLSTKIFRYLSSYYSTVSNLGFNARRAMEKTKREESWELLNNTLRDFKLESPSDVKYIRNSLLNLNNRMITVKNIDKLVLNYFIHKKEYNTCLNYIKYLDNETKQKFNLFFTNQYFRLHFYKRFEEKGLSQMEEKNLILLYENLRKSFPILDIISIEYAVLALSVTKEWRKCLDLLLEIKKTDEPSAFCYSAIAAGAFLHCEDEIGWSILKDIFEKDKYPGDIVFTAYIEKLTEMADKKDALKKLDKLFQECREYDIIFSKEIITELSSALKKHGICNELSSIDKRGCCTNCQTKLDILEATSEEFEKLKDKIFERVIVGKNIFSKTTPEEFLRFQNFLKTVNECDVVIDGLNVAYAAGTKQSTEVYSTLLAHVVAYFVNREKNIVVLGRNHMNRWPKKNWNYIKENAKIFLTQDISQDDPYLLYCALHYGKETTIVSKDLMRSHLFLLKDPKDKLLFSKWLTQRQYQLNYVTNNGKVYFKFPLPYTRTMQQNNGNWHVPYNLDNSKVKDKNEISNTWLCIPKSNIL